MNGDVIDGAAAVEVGESENEKQAAKIDRKTLRDRMLKVFASVVLIAGIIIGAYFFITRFFFKIGSYEILGAVPYSREEVFEKSGLSLGKGMFTVNLAKCGQKLTLELPYIKEATIKRVLPDKITIEVASAKPAFAYPVDGGYLIADGDNKLLEKCDAPVGDTAPVTGIDASFIVDCPPGRDLISFLNEKIDLLSDEAADETAVDEKAKEKAKELREARKEALTQTKEKLDLCCQIAELFGNYELLPITAIDVTKTYDITVEVDGRFTLRLGKQSKLEDTVKLAKSVVDDENRTHPGEYVVIDLSFGSTAYIRSRDSVPDTLPSYVNASDYASMVSEENSIRDEQERQKADEEDEDEEEDEDDEDEEAGDAYYDEDEDDE